MAEKQRATCEKTPSFLRIISQSLQAALPREKEELAHRERERERESAAAGYFQADLPVSLKQFTSNISSLILHQSF
ncbi:hypothetical protein P3L10_002555 [Capsicum annuum]